MSGIVPPPVPMTPERARDIGRHLKASADVLAESGVTAHARMMQRQSEWYLAYAQTLANLQLGEQFETTMKEDGHMGESGAVCRVVRPAGEVEGKQALAYSVGISRESVGSQALHMQLVRIPPGGRAKAHKHESHETAVYALSGTAHMWHGEELSEHSVIPPGSFAYIPANVPHLPYNPSETETVVAVIARTDPNEQESVVLLPGLDGVSTHK